MRRRSPRFAFRVWLMLVVSLLVPLACSGSSRNVEPPKPVASASASVAAAPPPDPCEVAAGLRKKVKPFLDEGRLHRTVRLIEKADRLCPKSAPETWAALVTTLAELGKYADARKVAAQIEADPNATAEAKAAAISAKERCDKIDKEFPPEGDAKEAMKKLYLEALAAEQKTDPESQRLAKEKYLAAWEAWRPNGQALLSAGFAARRLGQLGEAQRLFDQAIVDGEKAQGSEVKLEVPNGFSGAVLSIAWSKDGRRCAVAHENEISIFDTTWREKFRLLGHLDNVNSVAFSPDSKLLASASSDGTVRFWDVATGDGVNKLPENMGRVNSIAYSPDGKKLVVGCWNNSVRLWSTETFKEIWQTIEHEGEVNSVAFSPRGTTVASASTDQTVRIWDVATGERLHLFDDHKGDVRSVAYSPDGQVLASGSNDRRVLLWSLIGGKKIGSLGGLQTDGVTAIAYSPNGKTLVAGLANDTGRSWTVRTGARWFDLGDTKQGINKYRAEPPSFNSFAYSPDGKVLAFGRHKLVQIWDIVKREEIYKLQGHADDVESVAYSPDGKTLASGSRDKFVRIWDAAAMNYVRKFVGHDDWVTAVAFSPDGKTLGSGSLDNTVRLWNTGTEGSRILARHLNGVNAIAYAPNGKSILTGSRDNTVQLWDIGTGAGVFRSQPHTDWVMSVACSPSGGTFASGAADLRLVVWDSASYQPVGANYKYAHPIRAIAYAPDSRTMAVGVGTSVHIRDVATAKRMQPFASHASDVTTLAYSPDGQTLASGSSDATVKLWDVPTRNALRTLTGHGSDVNSVAYSPNGNVLASSGADGFIRLHRIKDGIELIALRALAKTDAHYALTPNGYVDLRGPDACSARQYPACRIGNLVFPFDVCEERFLVPGLYEKRMVGEESYLEPENAPTLMNCPDAAP